jgi:hypothetical protein
MRKFLLVLALSSGIKANAQLSIGPEIGMNISNISGAEEDYTTRMGGRLGSSADVKLTGSLYLQPGLFYSSKGGHTVTTSSQNLAALLNLAGLGDLLGGLGNTSQFTTLKVTNNISYTINYLQVPVLAVYKFKAGNSGNFFVGVGPYAALVLDGRYKKSSVSGIVGVSINSNEDRALVMDTDVTAFDFGLNGNVGYQHSSGFFCRGFYEMGLSDNNIGNNVSFGVSVGYFFHGVNGNN